MNDRSIRPIETQAALAEAMWQEFGARAAALARAQMEQAHGEAATSWAGVLAIIEKRLAAPTAAPED